MLENGNMDDIQIEVTPEMMVSGGDIIKNWLLGGMAIQAAQDLAREVSSSMLEEWFRARDRSQRSVP